MFARFPQNRLSRRQQQCVIKTWKDERNAKEDQKLLKMPHHEVSSIKRQIHFRACYDSSQKIFLPLLKKFHNIPSSFLPQTLRDLGNKGKIF